MSSDAIISILVSGIVLGSLYALMASGLSLIWGTLRIFNFAHGAMLMFSAYVAWQLEALGVPTLGAYAGAIACGALLGVVIQIVVIRPFLGRPDVVLIVSVTTLGASLFLISAAQIIWGPRVKQLGRLAQGTLEIFESAVSMHEVVIIVVAPLSLLIVALLLKRTRLGYAIRAVEENRDRARLVGISPPLVYAISMAIGGALAGLAGALLSGRNAMTPTMGNDPLIIAFVVVVFGGLGSLPGTVLAAYLVGLIEAFAVFQIGLFWSKAILFMILIGVLLIRPAGLLGRKE